MNELRAARVVLRLVDSAEAARVAAGRPDPHDCWAPDFPFDGDVVGATTSLRAQAARGYQPPFGHFLVIRTEDGRAIGGIGFKGQPGAGSVEIGYGLVQSAGGEGYAAEAVRALVAFAREQGLSRVFADADRDNVASQRTLEHAGLTRTGTRGDEYRYEVTLQRRRTAHETSQTAYVTSASVWHRVLSPRSPVAPHPRSGMSLSRTQVARAPGRARPGFDLSRGTP